MRGWEGTWSVSVGKLNRKSMLDASMSETFSEEVIVVVEGVTGKWFS